PHLGQVRFDPAQFEQVMVNLALNARDAMPGGGEFRIDAANVDFQHAVRNGTEEVPAGIYVSLRISDTGVGMTPEVVAKIFEPFFSTKERGTGLGLSTVYGIIKQSGGSIAAETAAGRGTEFTIFLPRLDAPVDTPLKEESTVPRTEGSETI